MEKSWINPDQRLQKTLSVNLWWDDPTFFHSLVLFCVAAVIHIALQC